MTARERIAGNVAGYVDDRTGAAKWMKKNLTKVFPDHWSFLAWRNLPLLIRHPSSLWNIPYILVRPFHEGSCLRRFLRTA